MVHPATALHPEDEVREGQVGQQLPVAHEQVQPLGVGALQPGVLLKELGERRHGPRLSGGTLTATARLHGLVMLHLMSPLVLLSPHPARQDPRHEPRHDLVT